MGALSVNFLLDIQREGVKIGAVSVVIALLGDFTGVDDWVTPRVFGSGQEFDLRLRRVFHASVGGSSSARRSRSTRAWV